MIAVSQTESKLASLQSQLGERLTPICVDLASWTDTEAKLAPVCQNVDLLVNNAGVAIPSLVLDQSEEELDKTLAINLKAPINLIRLVAPGMKTRKFGSIVNVSSISGLVATDYLCAYSASKGGLDMVTRVAAKELGPYNIRVNSVNPTIVWTQMGIQVWRDDEKRTSKVLERTPLGRFAEVNEVVDPILFLLSSKSSMITGISMPIDGGLVSS